MILPVYMVCYYKVRLTRVCVCEGLRQNGTARVVYMWAFYNQVLAPVCVLW